MNRLARGLSAAVTMLAAGMVAPAAFANWQLNMPVGVTTSSREIYDLHMLIFGVCVVIGIGVYAAMVVAIVRFRKSQGAVAAKFSHNTTIEVVWTVIPAAILVAMAIPATETLIRLEDTRDADVTVVVTGYQWRWHYEFLDEGVAYFSSLDRASNEARRRGSSLSPRDVENYLLEVDEPLVVPVDAKVRLLITGADVLHAWWVPELGVKKDAIPGFINETWFLATQTGVFRGQCAELCGMDHGFMPIVVEVRSQDEYERWLAERSATAVTRAN
jgi:cytochrome c oxidase subunit II